MKFLTGTMLGFALVLGATVPALAGSDVDSDLVGGQQVTGAITTLDGSELTINTATGSNSYQIDPDAVAALKLSQGSTIVIDSTRLETGHIVGIDHYSVNVKLDDGGKRDFVLSREGRRTLALGDRVVITSLETPSRCQKIYSAADFNLTAREVRIQPIYVATVRPPVPTVAAPLPPRPLPSVGGPIVEPPTPEVQGLW